VSRDLKIRLRIIHACGSSTFVNSVQDFGRVEFSTHAQQNQPNQITPTDKRLNQSINRSINQSINQSINRSVRFVSDRFV
jgi:hypothetical protein